MIKPETFDIWKQTIIYIQHINCCSSINRLVEICSFLSLIRQLSSKATPIIKPDFCSTEIVKYY